MPVIEGADQLRQVGVALRGAPARYRARLRRSIATATAPIVTEAKSGWAGYGTLGGALSNATRMRMSTTGRSVGVSIKIDAGLMPAGKESLPSLTEGERAWRHPLFGDRQHWYGQAARPELGPAVERHLPDVEVAVVAAISETAAELAAM